MPLGSAFIKSKIKKNAAIKSRMTSFKLNLAPAQYLRKVKNVDPTYIAILGWSAFFTYYQKNLSMAQNALFWS